MANKGLELDKENDVWEIRRLEANKFAIVNVNAAPGNSGDPKALEWYTKYSEFSTHYLNTTDGQFIFELYIKDYEPAHEHAYGEPVWTWNEDLTAATAKFTCECGDEQILDAAITEEVITEAAPHVAGEKKLTAKVTFNGTDYTDEKSVEIEALPCPCAAFTDMPAYGTVEHDAIDWAFTHNPQITTGTSDTTFEPEKTLTRAETVTFLWRAAGMPDPETTVNPFSDVKEGAWYYKAVLWAVENNITTGTGGGKFTPMRTCKISEIITFMYRANHEPAVGADVVNPYTDVAEGSWFYNAAMWALEKGIYAGRDATTFGGTTDCTRVEIVTFLYRNETGKGLVN
jgi:hypothetical protein